MISFLAVYTKVVDAIKVSYPTIYHSSVYKDVVPSSPAVFIREAGRYAPLENVDFTSSDVQYRMTVEIQVMSEKESGSYSEVNAILNLADTSMKSMYFHMESCAPLDLTDKLGYRVVARYARILGDSDTI